MIKDDLTGLIIKCAITVHSELGPGLLESSYEHALAFECRKEGLIIETQKALPLIYKDVKLEIGYRIDILVENKIIVEVKSVESIHNIHIAQALAYLKLQNLQTGLLLNFNVEQMKDGIMRLINNYYKETGFSNKV